MGYGNQNPNDPHPEDMRSIHHFWHPSERIVKVKVIKNTKGHSWEITAEAPTAGEVVKLAKETEEKLIEEFGSDGD